MFNVLFTAPPPIKKNRAELMKDIDADFYGYRIEDDGTILHDELRKEIESVSNCFFYNLYIEV